MSKGQRTIQIDRREITPENISLEDVALVMKNFRKLIWQQIKAKKDQDFSLTDIRGM